MKNSELSIADYKKREKASETKTKKLKQSFDAVSSDRNILSKNLLIARVIPATMPLNYLLVFFIVLF